MADLEDLFSSFYQFPTGRRIFAHRGVRDRVDGNATFVAHIDGAIAHDEQTLHLELNYSAGKVAPTEGEAFTLDVALDGVIVETHTLIATTADSRVEKRPRKEAKTLLTDLFPNGSRTYTHLSFEEEVSKVKLLIQKLEGSHKPQADKLNLGPMVESIADHLNRFQEALKKERIVKDAPTFDKVQASRNAGQGMLLETIARIVSLHPGRGEEDRASRAYLLEPVLVQNEAIGQAHRRRRLVADVNPNTGEVIPPTDGTAGV